MRDIGPAFQPAIQIRLQQLAEPSRVLHAALPALRALPERDHLHQTRFLVRTHHQVSGKSGYISQRAVYRRGHSRLRALRLVRLGHEFHAQRVYGISSHFALHALTALVCVFFDAPGTNGPKLSRHTSSDFPPPPLPSKGWAHLHAVRRRGDTPDGAREDEGSPHG